MENIIDYFKVRISTGYKLFQLSFTIFFLKVILTFLENINISNLFGMYFDKINLIPIRYEVLSIKLT